MRHPAAFTAAITSLLVLGGCQLTLLGFTVPANTIVGQVFDVVVEGTNDGQPGNGGCIVQLPLGFVVVGAAGIANLIRDEASLVAAYTPEPGHYLASWSAGGMPLLGVGRLKIFVQAPANPTTATIKVALAAQPAASQPYVACSPAGQFAFAQITAASNVRRVNVVAVPPTAFAPDADGLPFGLASANWSGVAFGDLDGDGDDDLVANSPFAVPTSVTQLRAWFRDGTTWTDRSTGLVGSGQNARVAIGDFDGDGFADIVQGNGSVFFGNGAGTWTPGPPFALLGLTYSVGTGDVNGDGRSDLAFGAWYGDRIQVFLGNANRTFTEASTGLPNQTGGPGSVDVVLRDVTGDGHVDVVWNQVWAGDGLGNWTLGTGLAGNYCWSIDTGDLDGDGQPELVFANVGGTATGGVVYRHAGNNQWALVPNTGLPSWLASSVALLDFDRDGRLDVVLGALASSGPTGIEVWRNLGGMSFALLAASGLPNPAVGTVADLAAGDCNADTFPDLAVAIGNEGLGVYQNWLGGLSAFGDGCAGTLASAPVVQGTSAPTLGNPGFGVRIAGGTPGTLGFCWLGISRRTWSGVPVLPLALGAFGAPDCTLWVGPESQTSAIFDGAGQYTRLVPIPANPALLRVTVFAQGAAFAPGSNPLALAFTAGLAIRVE